VYATQHDAHSLAGGTESGCKIIMHLLRFVSSPYVVIKVYNKNDFIVTEDRTTQPLLYPKSTAL